MLMRCSVYCAMADNIRILLARGRRVSRVTPVVTTTTSAPLPLSRIDRGAAYIYIIAIINARVCVRARRLWPRVGETRRA